MAQEQESGRAFGRQIVRGHRLTWRSGVVGGLLGGLVMGAMLSMLMPPVMEMAIPAVVGLSGGVAGWVVHMSISAVFGVGFVAVVRETRLRAYADNAGGMVLLGVLYGTALWLVAAAVVMPLWLAAVGFAGAPPVPNFNPMSLVAHVVFGVVTGVVARYG